MEKEYDFSNAEQGRFYRPISELEIPVYLQPNVRDFFAEKAREKNTDIGQLINSILLKEMKTLTS